MKSIHFLIWTRYQHYFYIWNISFSTIFRIFSILLKISDCFAFVARPFLRAFVWNEWKRTINELYGCQAFVWIIFSVEKTVTNSLYVDESSFLLPEINNNNNVLNKARFCFCSLFHYGQITLVIVANLMARVLRQGYRLSKVLIRN